MRARLWSLLFSLGCLAAMPCPVSAQEPPTSETDTRRATIEQAQEEKQGALHPFVPEKGERLLNKLDTYVTYGLRGWHPFLESAYAGGGFAAGAGYLQYVSGYNFLDMRGSYSVAQYKRAEAEFTAPRLFQRRGTLSVIGGWREATRSPSRHRYGHVKRRPRQLRLQTTVCGGDDVVLALSSRTHAPRRLRSVSVVPDFRQRDVPVNRIPIPSRDTCRGGDPDDLYPHSGCRRLRLAHVRGYSRRGGIYMVTAHDYTDRDKAFGFQQLDYDVTQHIPICAKPGSFPCTHGHRLLPQRATRWSRFSCCRRSAAARRFAVFPAGGFATATVFCCKQSGASSRTGS